MSTSERLDLANLPVPSDNIEYLNITKYDDPRLMSTFQKQTSRSRSDIKCSKLNQKIRRLEKLKI